MLGETGKRGMTMPRNVRNFWVSASVDGKASKMESGPQGKAGGFQITIKVRDSGSISPKIITILGETKDCRLTVRAFGPECGEVCLSKTVR